MRRRTAEIKRHFESFAFALKSLIKKKRDQVIDSQESVRVKEQRNACKISKLGRFRVFWDLFMISLSIMHYILTSLDLSFKFDAIDIYRGFDTSIRIFFMIDISMNFFTSYYRHSEEQTSCGRIFCNYFSTSFLIDLATSIPYPILDLDWLNYISLLKIIRIFSFKRILSMMGLKSRSKLYLKLCFITMGIILFYHSVACVLTVVSSDEWLPPRFYIDTRFASKQLESIQQYFQSVHYSLISGIGDGELGPQSAIESALFSVIMIFGGVLNVVTFAQITNYMQCLSKEQRALSQKLTSITSTMLEFQIPAQVRKRIQDFMILNQYNSHMIKQTQLFLQILSPSLKKRVLNFIFARVVKNNILFVKALQLIPPEIDDQREIIKRTTYYGIDSLFRTRHDKNLEVMSYKIKLITSKMEPVLAQPQQTVLNYDQKPSSLYFIERGRCQILSRLISKRGEAVVSELDTNYHFGDISVVFNCPTVVKVKSLKYCLFGKISKQELQNINFQFPGFNSALREQVLTYQSPFQSKVFHTLKQIELFQALSLFDLTRLVYHCQFLQFSKGKYLETENELPKGLWIILSGRVRLALASTRVLLSFKICRPGFVINHDRIFEQQANVVSAITKSNLVSCAFLSFQQIKESFLYEYKLKRKFQHHSQQIEKNCLRPYSLDYIITDRKTTKGQKPMSNLNRKKSQKFSIQYNRKSFHRMLTSGGKGNWLPRQNQHFRSLMSLKKRNTGILPQVKSIKDPFFKFKSCLVRIFLHLRRKRKKLGIVQKIKRQLILERNELIGFSEIVDEFQRVDSLRNIVPKPQEEEKSVNLVEIMKKTALKTAKVIDALEAVSIRIRSCGRSIHDGQVALCELPQLSASNTVVKQSEQSLELYSKESSLELESISSLDFRYFR